MTVEIPRLDPTSAELREAAAQAQDAKASYRRSHWCLKVRRETRQPSPRRWYLAEISRPISVRSIAAVVLNGARWHTSPLELNLVENIWEFLRANYLSHRVWDNYDVPSSMRAKAHGTSSC